MTAEIGRGMPNDTGDTGGGAHGSPPGDLRRPLPAAGAPAAFPPLLLQLRPGQRPAILRSRRPDLPALLSVGHPAAGLPERMAALHSLCAAGHRLAAQLAVRAAQGQPVEVDGAQRQALRLAVAREQLLRIAHDWPRTLPPACPQAPGGSDTCGASATTTAAKTAATTALNTPAHHPAPDLQGCPLWAPGTDGAEARMVALPRWLHDHWLHQPVAQLAAALQDEPAAQALAWARRTRTPLAALLAEQLPRAFALATPPADTLPPDALADTGPWSRCHDAVRHPAHNAGMRLVARLHDLLRLALPDGQDWLHVSAAPLGDGLGKARVEVGRGLLHYRVALGDGAAGPLVRLLRLQSPTDRNFHPQGVLAEALARVHSAADAQVLATAFDPCEPVQVLARAATADAPTEPAHA